MKRRWSWRMTGLWVVMGLTAGCTLADVRVNVVSERTALENQVLGSYNALSQDMLFAASVRGVDPSGRIRTPPKKSQGQQDALGAMQTLNFHADDVDAFKRLGWVGEDREGLLTPFPLTRDKVPDDLKDFVLRYQEKEFQGVIQEVNACREVVMRRVIEVNEGFTVEDLPRVRQVFAKMNRENAKKGEKIQLDDGTWAVK